MAIPAFSGYGYTAGANRARHLQSLGQFAGMNLPNVGYFGHGHVHGGSGYGTVTGYSPGQGVIGAGTEAWRAGGFGTPVPHFPNYGAPSQRPVAGVNALAYQGAPTSVRAATSRPSYAQSKQSQQARSQLWSTTKDAFRGPEPVAPEETPAGFRSLSQQRPPLSPPPYQLALEKGATPMGPSGWTTGGKLFELPQEPQTVGAPIPSTRSPRSRASSFNPNQGTLGL